MCRAFLSTLWCAARCAGRLKSTSPARCVLAGVLRGRVPRVARLAGCRWIVASVASSACPCRRPCGSRVSRAGRGSASRWSVRLAIASLLLPLSTIALACGLMAAPVTSARRRAWWLALCVVSGRASRRGTSSGGVGGALRWLKGRAICVIGSGGARACCLWGASSLRCDWCLGGRASARPLPRRRGAGPRVVGRRASVLARGVGGCVGLCCALRGGACLFPPVGFLVSTGGSAAARRGLGFHCPVLRPVPLPALRPVLRCVAWRCAARVARVFSRGVVRCVFVIALSLSVRVDLWRGR